MRMSRHMLRAGRTSYFELSIKYRIKQASLKLVELRYNIQYYMFQARVNKISAINTYKRKLFILVGIINGYNSQKIQPIETKILLFKTT